MELQIMYPPQKDSPTTFLMGAITTTDTFAIVGNAGLLPSNLPFPLTLGPDKPITEVVMVTEIDTENNRIVFERGSGALPWVAGTTVGRVFNASDLKTVQDNIVGINQEVDSAKNDILDLEEEVSDLIDVVGDSEGGLVKDLEDEIVRATNAEAAEVLRATTAEEALETKKVDRSDLPQVLTDTSYSADATKLTNTLTRYNASNKATTTYDRFIPLVTPESVGLMTPEAYNEITALRNDISALNILVNGKASPSTSVNATLSTSWSGTGPYTQNVTISGMTSTKNATVGLASTATEVQREAARDAIFSVTNQTTNQITITADGEKPTITIPISVILMP